MRLRNRLADCVDHIREQVWVAGSPVILRFSNRKTRHVAVEANPRMLRVSFPDLDGFQARRCEVDFQHVVTLGLQLGRNIDAMGDKHVVALENDMAIEPDRGKGVEAIEGQHRHGSVPGRSDLGQHDFVCPGLIGHPLRVELVESQEGVRNSMRSRGRSVMP